MAVETFETIVTLPALVDMRAAPPVTGARVQLTWDQSYTLSCCSNKTCHLSHRNCGSHILYNFVSLLNSPGLSLYPLKTKIKLKLELLLHFEEC